MLPDPPFLHSTRTSRDSATSSSIRCVIRWVTSSRISRRMRSPRYIVKSIAGPITTCTPPKGQTSPATRCENADRQQ